MFYIILCDLVLHKQLVCVYIHAFSYYGIIKNKDNNKCTHQKKCHDCIPRSAHVHISPDTHTGPNKKNGDLIARQIAAKFGKFRFKILKVCARLICSGGICPGDICPGGICPIG